MFSGIIENLGTVVEIINNGTNRTFGISSPLAASLKIDQSLAHNGVCLTVEKIIEPNYYEVTAIQETLKITNLGLLQVDSVVNLERCLRPDSLLDGHIVQGHVDTCGVLQSIRDLDGSKELRISFDEKHAGLIISKGSICVQGVSLTLCDISTSEFSVHIIPYTWEHTSLSKLKINDPVNLEFDIIGKYLLRRMDLQAG